MNLTSLVLTAALSVAALTTTALAQTGPTTTAATLPETAASDWRVIAPENLLVIDTSKGRILVELEPRAAPRTVERIQTLADRGFYDGLKFHRVIAGFMAQTGDPLGTGQGGSDLPDLAGEFSFRRGRDAQFARIDTGGPGNVGLVGSLPIQTQPDAQMMVTADFRTDAGGLFCGGVAGMARAASPDSANSQFFLMMAPNAVLNGTYTAFGRIVSGEAIVGLLKTGPTSADGAVTDNPDTMIHVRTAAALPDAERPGVRVLDARSAAYQARMAQTRATRGTEFSICDAAPVVEVSGG